MRQTVFLMRVGHAEIDIEAEVAEDPMPARFDRRLISQALTNIIKNATEAIAAVPAAELGKGSIHVFAARDGDDVVIDVVDNGIGLPKENRSRLLEPYVTTREKGTGPRPRHRRPHCRGTRRLESNCATPPTRSPASAAPGCACALPPPVMSIPPPKKNSQR